jgi:hypothetical protein
VNAFENASTVSQQSLRTLLPYLEFRGWTLEPYTDMWSQTHCGDYRATKSGTTMNLEVKSEKHSTGNLFIESWSNRTQGRPGWFHNLDHCDCLIYHFLDGPAYVIQFAELHKFDFSKYAERPQHQYTQRNDTWGWLVPVADLKRAGVITQEIGLPCN